MRPLFGSHSATVSPKQDQPPRRKKDEIKTLAETLDDVLPRAEDPSQANCYSTDTVYSYQFTPPTPAPTSRRVDDGMDEMEWTPTAPVNLPRALSNSPTSGHRAFGQAPVQEQGGPFYYRAPPAPINPARKMRNPPSQPALWGSTSEKKGENIFFARNGSPQGNKESGSTGTARGPPVEFRRQNFFGPRTEAAEDESLAKLLGKGFSLEDEKKAKKGWFNLGG